MSFECIDVTQQRVVANALTTVNPALNGRLYHVPLSSQRSMPAPNDMKLFRAQVFSATNLAADVQRGDLLTLPDGVYGAIMMCRSYDTSLQCDLQRIDIGGSHAQTIFCLTTIIQGSVVTLPNATVKYALVSSDERALTKFRRMDTFEPEKQPFVFEFDSSADGLVSVGMTLLWRGVAYVVDPPLHPVERSGVLITLAAVAYKL